MKIEEAISHATLSRQSLDLHGARFGDLEAEVVVGTDNRGHRWRFRCHGCGSAVLMHASTVRQRFAVHRDRLACRGCMREESGAKHDLAARILYRRMWERYRSLYSPYWGERVRADILDELERQVAPMSDRCEPAVSDGDLAAWLKSPVDQEQQRVAFLYPIGPIEDRLWRCVTCGEDFEIGFGCTLCVKPVCRNCVAAEKHIDSDDNGVLLVDIGRRYCLSRERIRQIVDDGIRKIRRALRGFLDEGVEADLHRSELREEVLRKLNPGHCGRCGQRIALGTVCVCCRRATKARRRFREMSAMWLRAAPARAKFGSQLPETAGHWWT